MRKGYQVLFLFLLLFILDVSYKLNPYVTKSKFTSFFGYQTSIWLKCYKLHLDFF